MDNFMSLIAPSHIQVYECDLAVFWIDDEGMLCTFAKDTSSTLEKQQEAYALIRRICGNKKMCMLSNATHSKLPDEATKHYMLKEMPKLFHAIAVLSQTSAGKATTITFQNLHLQTVPVMLFNDVESAKQWLRSYL